MSSSSRGTEPCVHLTRPETASSSVVFPEPFGPTSPTRVPGSTVMLTPSTARTPPNATTRLSITSRAGPFFFVLMLVVRQLVIRVEDRTFGFV